MLCEMCGADVASPILIKISGSILRACQKCSTMGVEATEMEKIGNEKYISDVLNKRRDRLKEKEIKYDKIPFKHGKFAKTLIQYNLKNELKKSYSHI